MLIPKLVSATVCRQFCQRSGKRITKNMLIIELIIRMSSSQQSNYQICTNYLLRQIQMSFPVIRYLLTSVATAVVIASGAPAIAHEVFVDDPICSSNVDSIEISAPVRRYCLSMQYRHSLHHVGARLTKAAYDQWIEAVRTVCTAGYPSYWASGLLLDRVIACEDELTRTLAPHLEDR